MTRCIALLLMLSGCATPAPREVVVRPVVGEYGVPECEIDGVIQPIPIAQQRKIITDILVANSCPVIQTGI